MSVNILHSRVGEMRGAGVIPPWGAGGIPLRGGGAPTPPYLMRMKTAISADEQVTFLAFWL